MSDFRQCDACRAGRGKVERLGLRRQVWRQRPDGTRYHSTEGVGSIDLCADCLERIALPRKRPEQRFR